MGTEEMEIPEVGTEIKPETEKNIGTIKIADDVVTIVAAIAALEVEGVAEMAGGITAEQINKSGAKGLGKGIKVEVADGDVRVSLSLVIEYGYSIPATVSNVQARVKSAIENMTGLHVTDVNAHIAGINMAK